MRAQEAIARLRGKGIILTADGDALSIRAADGADGAITPKIRAWIDANEQSLVAALKAPPQPDLSESDRQDIAEAVDERAAIREYDGKQPRAEAERNARSAVRVYRYRLTDRPDSWMTMISPGADFDEAERILSQTFPGRVLDVREYVHDEQGIER